MVVLPESELVATTAQFTPIYMREIGILSCTPAEHQHQGLSVNEKTLFLEEPIVCAGRDFPNSGDE